MERSSFLKVANYTHTHTHQYLSNDPIFVALSHKGMIQIDIWTEPHRRMFFKELTAYA